MTNGDTVNAAVDRKKPMSRKRKIFLVIVLLLVLLSAGEHFFKKPIPNVSPLGPELADCQRPFTPRYNNEPYYSGELFDAHFHIPPAPGMKSPFMKTGHLGKDVTLNEILCGFDKERVRGALGFYMPYKEGSSVTLPQADDIYRRVDGRIRLFISPVILNAKDLEKILDENPGKFMGIGEMFFYEITNLIRPIDGKWANTIYDLAERRGLPIMLHPGRGQMEKLEKVLREHPKVTFILHGHELERDINRLMAAHPNVYYSVDGAVLHAMRGKMVRGPEGEYVETFQREFSKMLDESAGYWRDRIGQFPDRFMWGTDRSVSWNYGEEMSVLMEEFGRGLIGRLDPSVQEDFAYKNAERLLGQFTPEKNADLSPAPSPQASSQPVVVAKNSSSTLFTHKIFDPSTVVNITPLGELNGGYEEAQAFAGVMINLKPEAVANGKKIDIFAPTDMKLENYAYYVAPEDGINQWTLIFRASKDVVIKFDHISEVTEQIIAATTSTPAQTSAEQRPRQKLTVKAGDLIARTSGTSQAHNWNIYLTDKRHTNQFANPKRFKSSYVGKRMINAACPFNYYNDGIKAEYMALMGYDKAGQSATCGSASRDKVGTVAGQWFLDSNPSSGLEVRMEGDYASPLAIFKNSAGTVLLDQLAGKRLEVPAGSATDKDPESVTDSHCYAVTDQERPAGYVYLKLLAADQLAVSYGRSGSCPSALPADSKTYYR